jgi:hypothetical protein
MAKKDQEQDQAPLSEREQELLAENERLLVRLQKAEESGDIPAEIPGEYNIAGYETPDGKLLTGKAKFKDGKKYVIAFQHRVSTAALMKVANGEQLTEQERRENVALVNAGREACEALLQRWITSGSTFFKFI